MAYLKFAGSEERQSSAFKFIGADNKTQSTGLISNNTSLISNNVSLLSSPSADDCLDTCSFYSGPSDSAIMAFGETCGSIAYSEAGETCGSIAYTAGETCGSIASTSSSSSSFGGGCCYSC